MQIPEFTCGVLSGQHRGWQTLETRGWNQRGLLRATTRAGSHKPEPISPPQPVSRAVRGAAGAAPAQSIRHFSGDRVSLRPGWDVSPWVGIQNEAW